VFIPSFNVGALDFVPSADQPAQPSKAADSNEANNQSEKTATSADAGKDTSKPFNLNASSFVPKPASSTDGASTKSLIDPPIKANQT